MQMWPKTDAAATVTEVADAESDAVADTTDTAAVIVDVAAAGNSAG